MALRWLAWTAVCTGLAASWTAPGLAQNPVYRDPAQPVDIRVADLLARMTIDEKVAQLLGVWQQRTAIQRPDSTFNPDGAKALIGDGIGQIARPSEIAGTPDRRDAHAARARAVRQRRPEVAHRQHPPRHPGHVSRRSAARTDRAARHALPRADRPGQHLGSRARRARDGRRRARGARARQPARAVAGGGSRPRRALGPHRGNLRRGSVPRLAHWAWPRSAAIRDDRCHSRRTRCLPR